AGNAPESEGDRALPRPASGASGPAPAAHSASPCPQFAAPASSAAGHPPAAWAVSAARIRRIGAGAGVCRGRLRRLSPAAWRAQLLVAASLPQGNPATQFSKPLPPPLAWLAGETLGRRIPWFAAFRGIGRVSVASRTGSPASFGRALAAPSTFSRQVWSRR